MVFTTSVILVCIFTFIIHTTESLAYSMRLAGVRTKQVAIAMAFVTSTLLVSRLSNMFQAPLLGAMVDSSILMGDLNFDGIINVIDVVSLVNGILGGGLTDDQQLAADLNGDGTINVIDIVSLVNIILG